MRWYEKLYVGEKAKKKRYSIIRAVRAGKKSGYYILTLPSNDKNLLDIYPAITLQQPYYREKDFLILGVAADYEDAANLAGTVISEVYRKTGGFDVAGYLKKKTDQEHV